jgi:hypothetical protein
MQGRVEDLRTINRESVVFSRNSRRLCRRRSYSYNEREKQSGSTHKRNEAHKVIFIIFELKKKNKLAHRYFWMNTNGHLEYI